MRKTKFFHTLLALTGLIIAVGQTKPVLADAGQWNSYIEGGVDHSVEAPLEGQASRSDLVSGDAMSAFATQQPLQRLTPKFQQQTPVQYRTNIKKQQTNLNGGLNGGGRNPSTLSVQDLKLLSKNDIAILIDKSWSMGNHTHEGGLRRWDWCQQQVMGFTSQTASAFPKGIDVILFDSEFVVYQNVDMNAVKDIFTSNKTGSGTNLDSPLQTVFDEHFKRRDQGSNKNLVVIIISDVSAKKGRSVIEKTMPRITRPGEISVTYLNLKTSDKEKYMPFTTNGLPIKVEQIPWDAVNAQGLTQTILQVIHNNK